MKNNALPITDEINLHYLLELMPPLYEIPEFALLPELFSTVGIDSLLALCKYAGGETIKIPTIDELSTAILALDVFYTRDILKQEYNEDVSIGVLKLYERIKAIYDSQNGAGTD